MKLCPNCHIENASDANYCDKCSYKLSELQPQPRLCAAGKHPMDPAWSSCPYCKAAQGKADAQANIETVTDPVTDADTLPRVAVNRKTAFAGVAQESAMQAASYLPGRRIVGVLVTYSWRREGLIFPVYEGRNYLGSDAECEISLPSDDQLSRQHATIFYRGEVFEICDEKSLNGTWMNGKPVSLRGEPLENYAEFKTGSTVWKFIALEPGSVRV